MKNQFLFPHRYRLIGWVLFVPSLVLGLACLYADFGFEFLTVYVPINSEIRGGKLFDWPINLTDELAALGVIAGLMLIGFSKEKIEDELSARLRLDALQWSVYVNYAVLALAIVFVHGDLFFNVMVYNLFTGLLVFVVRFRWLIFKNSRAAVGALAL
jgi:hypothetical protein